MTSPGGLHSGAVRLFTCRRLIAFGLNLSLILSDTAKFSGIQPFWRRETQVAGSTAALASSVTACCVLYYIHLSRVCAVRLLLPVCMCAGSVCWCVFFYFVRDWWGWTAFILFNLSLISLVWNFNSCNKSASGYGGDLYTQCRQKVCECVHSLIGACVSVWF